MGIGRIIFWAVLAALAYMCVGVQTDYSVEDSSAAESLVPYPFASMAYVARTNQAVANDDAAAALTNARLLVLHRPVQSESLSRLAQAYVMNGDEVRAGDALLTAAGRGWRDPIAQLAVLEGAISVEDWTVVAQRLSAMRKLRHPREWTDAQLTLLASSEEGRRQLAKQMAADPLWLGQFAQFGPELMTTEQFSAVFNEAVGPTGSSACNARRNAATSLLESGSGYAANAVWTRQCVVDESSGEAIANFSRPLLKDQRGPFSWDYPNQPGLSRKFKGGDTVQIEFTNNDRLRRMIAQRYTTLRPGRAKLELSMSDAVDNGGNRPASAVELRMICVHGAGRMTAKQVSSTEWTLVIPANGCEAQRIRLLADRGSGVLSGITLSAAR